ncbi:MAG: shikimate kinase, partial [Candidatus Lutacidiplasmatales archaeon]
MIGHARTTGAISIVNALATGVGAAIGVELWAEAEVELGPSERQEGSVSVTPVESDTPLVRACAAGSKTAFARETTPSVKVRIQSEIPQRSGLKSSSAVGTAVVLAMARALGSDPSAEQAARRCAESARQIGQSATGAFDDCLASCTAGISITDNRTDRLLRVDPLVESLVTVLWIPPGAHPPSPEIAHRFQGMDPGPAVSLVLAGRPWEAMEANSEMLERVFGFDGSFRPALHRLGARAVGVSGLGPAWAVVVPPDRAGAVSDFLSASAGVVRTVTFRRDRTSRTA